MTNIGIVFEAGEPLGFLIFLPKMKERLTGLWIGLAMTIAMLLLINLVLRDKRVKDIAFRVLLAWLIDSAVILLMHLTGLL